MEYMESKMQDLIEGGMNERDSLYAEIARLRAENASLRVDSENVVRVHDESERLRAELEATRKAAQRGMDAATAVSYGQLREAHRLACMSSPEALESERAANAELTSENERLRAEVESLKPDAQELNRMQLARDNVALRAQLDEARKSSKECYWSGEDIEGMWEGTCGVKWVFIEGGPVENELNYCPKCGGKVTAKTYDELAEEDDAIDAEGQS